MKSAMIKTSLRQIKHSLGRYLAIFFIVALGVIMFSGLRVCRKDMVATAQKYFDETMFFEYRLLSTLGFEKDDSAKIAQINGVKYAEGGVKADVIVKLENGREIVVSTYSLLENINKPDILEGRLPENDRECVVDGKLFDNTYIGKKLVLAESNTKDTLDKYADNSYTIVGRIQSPLYLNFERGTSSVGNGSVSAFAYFLRGAFTSEIDTEIYVRMEGDHRIYTQEYDDFLDDNKNKIEDRLTEIANDRYENIRQEIISQALESYPGATYEMVEPVIQPVLDKVKEPSVYVLDRNTNVGYASFDNDSNIVNQIAAVFPIFFLAVAALVCMTTMTRMVKDERTQIGVLKALGYSDGTVMSKYLFYSGSAAISGALFGYVIGNILFPKAIWMAYNMLYDFAPLVITWDVSLAIISLVAATVCSMGATYFSCSAQFHSSPANLIRPKAPKSGKRIFLERVGFIWKRLSFLKKVSIRNVFRYKKRFIMMILGIGGCTALVVTALGLKDSFSDIVKAQFRDVSVYDISITLGEALDEENRVEFADEWEKSLSSYCYHATNTMELENDIATKSTNVVVPENEEEFLSHFKLVDIKTGENVPYPGNGEVVITKRLSKIFKVKAGDTLTIRDDNLNSITLTVKAVCKNYLFNYAFISKDSYEELVGKAPEYKSVYARVNAATGEEKHQLAANIMSLDKVSSVSVNSDTEERFDSMLSSLNYVVIMVIVLAAALAFVVLYNLTNINITERIREIATIKVLGFNSFETAIYVFRENFILTFIGALLGLGLGKLLHMFVMECISVEAVMFDSRITLLSYILSIVITFVFAIIVNIFMLIKLGNIKMAESLKSVE